MYSECDKAPVCRIVVIITSVVLDVVLYGRDVRRLIYIISDHAEKKIAGDFWDELDIGVTYVQGSGAYSGGRRRASSCAP